MKLRTTILSILFSPFFLLSAATAQITADSDIISDTNWESADSPVTVTETISIEDGATLTISPGVTVLMESGTSILVDGALVSEGTDADEISFTSSGETPGDWGSIEFRSITDQGSVIDYTTFEYGAGSSRSGMVFFTTDAFPVDISNSTFRQSADHGINLRAANSSISNSAFYDNAGYGVFADLSLNFSIQESDIYRNAAGGVRVPLNSQAVINESLVDSNGVGILIENNGRPEITNSNIRANDTGIRIQEVGSSQPTISDNVIAGNSDWGLESLGGDVLDARFNFWGSPLGPTVSTNPTGEGDAITENIDYTPWRDGSGMDLPVTEVNSDISTDETWQSGNVYLVTSSISITSGNTLTIEPGTIVKFSNGVSLTVDGVLDAAGTDDSLITFTSSTDDAAGGDSNEDGDATTPGAGDWEKINFNNSGSTLSYAVVRYGAGTGRDGTLSLSAAASLSNIFVNNNSGSGIYSEVSQSGWSDVSSSSNSDHGFYFYRAGLQMTVGKSSLNGSNGLYIVSADSDTPVNLDGFESTENNSHGVYVNSSSTRNTTRIEQLINSTISGNGEHGIWAQFTESGSQLYENNTIENNSGHGISLYHGLDTPDVIIRDNIFTGNGETGVRANRARLIDNTFESNKFGIGTWKNLGLSYTDDSDADGNTFSNNTYGGIALYAENLDGTISATVPDGLANPTYVMASTGSANDDTSVLTIEPGVTIKSSPTFPNSSNQLRFDGQLIVQGSEENPVTFTSVYDHEYGGNVAPEGDETAPSRGDWGGVQLFRGGTSNSTLENVNIRYARTNLEMGTTTSSTVDYTNTIRNIWIDNAEFHGILIEESLVEFEDLTVTNSGRHGIFLRDRNSNGTSASVEISSATIENNGGSNNSYAGLFADDRDDGATYSSVTNSVIENNANGVIIEKATAVTIFGANQIRDNQYHGVSLNSNREREDISFFGNTFSGNGEAGVRSSKAIFIDNTFENNRFSVGAWQQLGHIFVDENGVDNNVFTGNTYRNSIALYANNLRDTLSATMPEAFDQPAYLLASSGTAVNSSDSLRIDAGVTIKTAPELVKNSTQFRIDGQLLAEGTESSPIVFTSLFDHDYGGNLAREEDETEPSRGDWGGIQLFRGGTVDSRISNVFIRYARTNLEMGTTTSSQTEYSHVFENLWIDNAEFNGILIEESSVEFDGLRATNNSRHGVFLRDRNDNGFRSRALIRNSEIRNNGGNNDSYAGLFADDRDDGASYTEITNTIIEGNSNGVFIEASPLPSSIQFNTIQDNSSNGLFARFVNVSSDTSLAVTGNTFSGHQNGTGMITTRAVIEDNNFEDNRLPIALMGELSRDETSTEDGNFYEGNTFSNHTFADAIGIYSESSVPLDGNLGRNWPQDYEDPVYIPTSGTLYINSSDSVNVAPGTVFKLGADDSNQSFRIRGTMIAEGTADNKIIFTSILDDTYAGDTNLDGTDSAPSRGDWDELLVDQASSSQTLFKHVITRYADTNLYFDNNTEATVDSSFVSNARYGVFSEDGAMPTIRYTDIHTNQYGMRIQNDSEDPTLQLNNFYNNDDAAMYAFRDVTATNNYWGDSTGPFVDESSNTDPNLDGEGDVIEVSSNNRVEYEPWQVSRSGVLLGDVSEAGSVTAFDASLILQYVVDDIELSTSQQTAADVTGDGSITAFDASNILQFVVGAISGFPGAGKAPAIEAEDLFMLDTQVSDASFDLIIQSKGALPFYSGQIALDYDHTRFSSVELIGTAATSEWSDRIKAEDGTLTAALAGVDPVSDAADLIHLRFHFGDDSDASPGEMNITELKLNEIDLTDAANQVATSNMDELEVPKEFSLEQNYPNPFNPTTNIEYQLPESGEVTVTVYNAIGRQVARLVNQKQQSAGIYTVNWDAGSAASGVYFYRVEVAAESGKTFMDVKKMTLIK